MPTRTRHSLLCPNCRRLISADETECPHCGLSNPTAWWRNVGPASGLLSPDTLVLTIIGVNVVLYLISLVLFPSGLSAALNPFRFLSPSNKSLLLLGATGVIPIDQFRHWWSLLAANYLHGGLLHILFNMLALRQLGPFVVQEYGAHRMIVIYTMSGVIGFAASYVAGVQFTIGASAAICGLIGAILYYSKTIGGHYGDHVYRQVGGWLIGIFLIGLMPGINNWGHGGGLLAGLALGYLLKYSDRRRENYVDRLLAYGCVLCTALVLAWAVGFSIYYKMMTGTRF